MDAKLVVTVGRNAGKEIPLKGPRFFIGHAQDCHFRPHTDSVARHHCVVLVEDEFVAIRDMGSRAGTFVNGDRITREHELKDRDRVRVGDMELEVRLNVGVVEKESELPARGEASTGSKDLAVEDDLDLDHWLNDTQVSGGTEPADAFEQPAPELPDEAKDKKKRKTKKEKSTEVVGVWKKGHWKPTSVDPGQAAADTLKKFFKRH